MASPAPLGLDPAAPAPPTAAPPDDYDDELLNYPSEHRNFITKFIINELQSQNMSSRLVKPTVALAFGLADTAYNPLAAGHPFASSAGQRSFSAPDAAILAEAAGGGGPLLNSSVPLPPRPYLGDVFFSFHSLYWPFHCITCLIICTLGIFANVTNIVVLTRPNMKSAVNVILCAMAFSDLVVNVSNIPYLVHELGDQNYTFAWAIYTLFHAHTTVTAHTISIWLTCVLATWRYCVVCRSQSTNQRNWSVGLAYRVIIVVFIFVPIFCIPNYLSFAILQETTEGNSTLHKVGFSQLADSSQFIKTFHFWIFSVLTKLVPCVLLTFFTTALIRKLLSARERRLRLAHGNSNNNANKSHVENGMLVAQRPSIPGEEQERKLSASQTAHTANGLLSVPGRRTRDAQEEASDSATVHINSENSQLSRSIPSLDQHESSFDKIVINSPLERPDRNDSNKLLVDGSHGGDQRTARMAPDDRRNRGRGRGHQADQHHQQSRMQHSNSSSATTDVDTTHVCSELTSSTEDNADLLTTIDNQQQQQQQQPVILNHLIVESCPAKSGANNKTISKTSKVFTPTNNVDSNNNHTNESWNLMPFNEDHQQAHNHETRSASTGSATFLGLYACTTDDNTGVRQQLIQSGSNGNKNIGSMSTQNISSNLPRQSSFADQAKDKQTPEAGKTGATTTQGSKRVRSVGSTSLAPFQMVKLQASQRQLTQNETTTRLLIAVMIVFLICESPAGILSILCAILGQEFFDNVYQPMGILTDLLALINSSVNFVLYCFMSTQFRVTFYQVVLHCPAPNVKPKHQQQHQHQLHQHHVQQQQMATTTKLQNTNGSPKQPKATRDDY